MRDLNTPGQVIGYRKDGRPIRLIAGGSEPTISPGGAPTSQTVPPVIPPVNAPPQTQPSTQYFTAEQVEAIRAQEKDKLYDRMKKTDDQLAAFKSTVDQLKADKDVRDAEIEAQRLAAEDAQRQAAESKMTAEQLIQSREAELKVQQDNFQKDMELKLATMAKEQEFLKLQSYIRTRVAEEIAANTIIPDLVEFIGGESEIDVEASITKVKEKTANIVKGATTLNGGSSQLPGVSPTGSPAGPLDNLSPPRGLSAEEIAKMGMADYAKFRSQSGIDRAGNGQGLFG